MNLLLHFSRGGQVPYPCQVEAALSALTQEHRQPKETKKSIVEPINFAH